MRDIALVSALLAFLPMSVAYPAAGALCWAWFSIMAPHQQVYGFAAGRPLNSLVAAATLLGWILSKERKRWPSDAVPWLMLAWFAWMTLGSYFAINPGWSWPYWDRVMRILALVFLVFFLANTKARIHGFIWILVISIGYYGVKGGIFTLLSGGNSIVYGPPNTDITDNNQLALAVVGLLPLVNYLRLHTRNSWLRLGLAVSIGLQIVVVLGSYSRGGVIALAVTLGVFWARSRNKVVYAVVGVLVVGAALGFMPDRFWDRLSTLNNVGTDDSFQGRVMAWHVATLVAIDQFPFGAGFYAPQLPQVFNFYFPGEILHAAHSIYFQILGEHGFIGLGIYLLLLLFGLRNTRIVMRQTRGKPELRWAYDLANMSQVGMIGYYVGGAALSMAYYDGYLIVIALMSTLRALTAPMRVTQRAQVPSAAPANRAAALQPVQPHVRPAR